MIDGEGSTASAATASGATPPLASRADLADAGAGGDDGLHRAGRVEGVRVRDGPDAAAGLSRAGVDEEVVARHQGAGGGAALAEVERVGHVLVVVALHEDAALDGRRGGVVADVDVVVVEHVYRVAEAHPRVALVAVGHEVVVV